MMRCVCACSWTINHHHQQHHQTNKHYFPHKSEIVFNLRLELLCCMGHQISRIRRRPPSIHQAVYRITVLVKKNPSVNGRLQEWRENHMHFWCCLLWLWHCGSTDQIAARLWASPLVFRYLSRGRIRLRKHNTFFSDDSGDQTTTQPMTANQSNQPYHPNHTLRRSRRSRFGWTFGWTGAWWETGHELLTFAEFLWHRLLLQESAFFWDWPPEKGCNLFWT